MTDSPLTLKQIAVIRTPFSTKFGIPRQSGLVTALKAQIVFLPEYRTADALRGLEDFTHLWLIWSFSDNRPRPWSATVRPPRLGGNTRMGVFATRSPYRPNPIGLSSVVLERIEQDEKLGPVIWVSGADLMDGTPIYDIKPYLPYTDCHPDATGGFTARVEKRRVTVDFPEAMLAQIPAEHHEALLAVLAQDPRPAYQDDPDRRYGFAYAGYDVRFTVREGVLTVVEVEKQL